MNPQGKPKLVYLPGIDGTGRLMHRQRGLHERFDLRCVSYPQHIANSYRGLAKLGADALGPEGGIVLAESFGGAVALTLALKWPERVRQLFLLNTFAHFPRAALLSLINAAGPLLPRRPFPPRFRALRGMLFFPPDTPVAEQDAWWELTADVPVWAYGMRVGMISRLDLRSRLAEVKAPCTVFVSPNDRVVPPTAGRLLAKRMPNAKLIEAPYGHGASIHPGLDIAELLLERNGATCRQVHG